MKMDQELKHHYEDRKVQSLIKVNRVRRIMERLEKLLAMELAELSVCEHYLKSFQEQEERE